MIVWLASYPKSGNTLLRSMLAAYFFSKDGIFDFDLIKNIKQFPTIELFENMGINVKKEEEVIKNYINLQALFNKKYSVQFLKTHSYLFNIKNHGFTDLNNSLGSIYIVRDPRNVVTSLANYKNISPEEACDIMIKSNKIRGDLSLKSGPERTTVYIGTWALNFNSWKSFKFQDRYLLIKYEDLINQKEKTFIKVLSFIFRLKKKIPQINLDKMKNVISSTIFYKMKKKEEEEGFNESSINEKTKEKISFFNLGPQNDWKKIY
jgi:hypothetical protein